MFRISQYSRTAAELAAENLPLPKGVIQYESDTNFVKVGDGSTKWNDLPYHDPHAALAAAAAAHQAADDAMQAALDAPFTAYNLRGEWEAGEYLKFDLVTHDGSTYVATDDTDAEPPAGEWQLFAAQGAKGDPGSVDAVVAGDGIEVDDTDAANPIVAVKPSVLRPGVVCSDSFARADGSVGSFDNAFGGTAAPAAWSLSADRFEIEDGKLAPVLSVGLSVARAAVVPADAEVEMRITAMPTTATGPGPGLRMDAGTNDGYYLRVSDAGVVQLRKRVGEAAATLATSAASAVAAGDRVSIRAVGRLITCRVNGATLLSVEDSDLSSSGHAGVYRGTDTDWRADQFVVRDLGPGRPL